MGFQTGTNDTETGALGFTKSNTNVGISGRADSDAPSSNAGVGGSGVFGFSTVPDAAGVFGINEAKDGRGVQGNGLLAGVRGSSEAGNGVRADSNTGDAILATTNGLNKSAVLAFNNGQGDAPEGGAPGGIGVFGVTIVRGGTGVFGTNNSTKGRGVQGNGPDAGIGGFSEKGSGVLAQSVTGIAILAQGGHLAGRFEGNVEVTGDIGLVNADCAEDFDVLEAEQVEPGTVMVIDETGALQQSRQAYDKKVAGVVSGAGGYKPGIVLDKQQSQKQRQPIALLGKVYCKVDAQYGAIEVGDLLTTSPTCGRAMKATDPQKAFGTVIGKALRPLEAGQGLIPILIALQ